MNYLAHAYLANTADRFMIGNLIADFVKGSVDKNYEPEIAAGIVFHRKVDAFADGHKRTAASRRLFAPARRRTAGIVLDICYDHFLAKNWGRYADIDLAVFISCIYDLLQSHTDLLPERFRQVFPRMLEQNWLASYQSLQGVQLALTRISRRLRGNIRLDDAMADITANYGALEANFSAFFPDLIEFARNYRQDPL
jgi:acyl carrier protein phosphodiesterase